MIILDQWSEDVHRAVVDLVRRLGSVYFYDLDLARANANALKATLADVNVLYSVKANPCPPLLRTFANALDGLEVSSIGELQHAQSLGVAAASIVLSGPHKTGLDLMVGLQSGLRAVHVESIEELREACVIRDSMSAATTLAIRVNPGYSLNAPWDNMGGGPSQFGVDEEELLAEDTVRNIEGLHVYAASQVLDPKKLVDHIRAVGELYIRLKQRGHSVTYVNVGGGFGVNYGALSLEPLDVTSVVKAINELARLAKPGKVFVELGRYLAASYGVFATSVLRTKVSRGRRYAVLAGGANAFARPSLTQQSHAVTSLTGRRVAGVRTTLVGPLCTATDVFGELTGFELRPGDVVSLLHAGAYGWNMSPHYFLGHPTPGEAVISNGTVTLVREPVRPCDYLNLGLRDTATALG